MKTRKPTRSEIMTLSARRRAGKVDKDGDLIVKLALKHPDWKAEKIAEVVGCSKATVWRWIKRWNERGVDGLLFATDEGGRPYVISDEQVRLILNLWDTHPTDLGVKQKRWTFRSFSAFVNGPGRQLGLPEICPAWLFQIIKRRVRVAAVPD